MNVSIVIPTFNRKYVLREVLESLFNQTYPKDKFEIIICDDGSTDGTDLMVKELITSTSFKMSYLKVNSNHKGPSNARNVGVFNSSGEIIGFIDDDCIATPTWIEDAIPYFQNKAIGGVQGSVLPQELEGTKPRKTFRVKKTVRHTDDNGRYVTANLFLRREAAIRCGGFNRKFTRMQDTDLVYRIKKLGYNIIFDKSIITYHRVIYVGFLQYIKSLKKYEFLPLLVKENPEVRKTLYIGFIERKQDIYPSITLLFLFSLFLDIIVRINTLIIYSLLVSCIISYLWGRVIRDNNIRLYPLRILAFFRNFIIDIIVIYYLLKGSIRYKSLVI